VITKIQFLTLLAILTAAGLLFVLISTEDGPLPAERATPASEVELPTEVPAASPTPPTPEASPSTVAAPPVQTRTELKPFATHRTVELIFSGVDQEIVRPLHLYRIESETSVKEIVGRDQKGDSHAPVADEFDTVLVATFEAHLPLMIGIQAGAASGTQFPIPVVPGGSLEFTYDSFQLSALEIPPSLWLEGFYDGSSGPTRNPGRVCPVDFGSTVDWRVPSASNLSAALPTSTPDSLSLRPLAELIHRFMLEQFKFKANDGLAYAPLLGFDPKQALTGSSLRWDWLPAGGPYLWQNSAKFEQVLQPGQAAAINSAEKARGSDQPGFQSVRQWRGNFRIEAGRTTSIQLEKRPPGILKGRLPLRGPDPIHSARVSLARLLRVDRDVTPADTGLVLEQVYLTAQKTEFQFEDLPPGEYRLAAHWSTPGKVFVVTQTVNLTAQGVDLGTLTPLPTEPVALTIGFKDMQGQPVDPEVVLAELPDEAWLELTVAQLRTPDPLLGIYIKTAALAGRTTLIYGLPPGRCSFKLRHYTFEDVDGNQLAFTKQNLGRSTEVPLSEPLEFFYTTAGVQEEVEFLLHFPDQDFTTRFDWEIASSSSSGLRKSGTVPMGIVGPIPDTSLKLKLPKGNYQLYVSEGFSPEPKPRTSWFACFDFETSPVATVHQVNLEPAVSISGTLLDAGGSPVKNNWAVFVLRELQGRTVYPEIKIIGIPDAKGNFVLNGVPPGAELQDPRSKKTYQPHPDTPLELIAD
jgi:hypothetical protein